MPSGVSGICPLQAPMKMTLATATTTRRPGRQQITFLGCEVLIVFSPCAEAHATARDSFFAKI